MKVYPLILLSLSLVGLPACQTIDPAVQDCQQLLEEINHTVVEAQNLTQNANAETDPNKLNLENWLQAADILKQGSEAIAQLTIRDETLKTYQTEIAKIYNDQAQATYDMVKARQQKNLEAALKAQKLAQTAGEQEQTTGTALNNYCQAKEKNLKRQ